MWFSLFCLFVCLLVEDGRLPQVLTMVTGFKTIPPLGFKPKPTLAFRHSEDVPEVFNQGIPFINTCAHVLHVPVVNNYEDFYTAMTNAMDPDIGQMFTDI